MNEGNIKETDEMEYAKLLGKFVARLINNGKLCKKSNNDYEYANFNENSELYVDLSEEISKINEKIEKIDEKCRKMRGKRGENTIISQYYELMDQWWSLEYNANDNQTQMKINRRRESVKRKLEKLKKEDKKGEISTYEELLSAKSKKRKEKNSKILKIFTQEIFLSNFIIDFERNNQTKENGNQVIRSYVESFMENINFEKVAKSLDLSENDVVYFFRKTLTGEYLKELENNNEDKNSQFYKRLLQTMSNGLDKKLGVKHEKNDTNKEDEINANSDYSRNKNSEIF